MKGLWHLLSRIKDYKRSFTLSIISNILLSVFTVISIPILIPFFQILFNRIQTIPVKPSGSDINEWLKYYISELIQDQGKETALLWVCGSLILVFFLKNLFRYSALYFMAPLRNGIIYDLRKQLYQKFLDLPLSFYSNERKGVLLSSITLDVQEVEWSILNVIETIFKSPIIMLGSIFFMLYISPALTLFVSVLVIFAGFIIGKLVTNLKDNSVTVQNSIAKLTSHVEETLGGIRIIKGFNAESYHSVKFDRENKNFRKTLTKVVNKRDMSAPLSEFLGVSVVTVLMWYGSKLVFKNSLEPETFFAFVFAFYQVIEPAKSFSSAYFNIQKGLASMDRIDRILMSDNEIISKPGAQKISTFSDSIIFDKVSFRYKDQEIKALNDISVKI
ncbi:MAG: ABC transporter ATP-binding protein, partial [Saprospiraceae bacterium]|nr:ABC transporter ATP-binding protein [Saprospiraceae bacterium]